MIQLHSNRIRIRKLKGIFFHHYFREFEIIKKKQLETLMKAFQKGNIFTFD
jgi:hypothetical protein